MASGVDKESQTGLKDDIMTLELPAPPAWKKLQYLKSHPGNPAISECTGETPRRSTRISEKAKATPPSAESEPPKKRGHKSLGSREDSKAVEEIEGKKEVEMKDVEVTEKENAEAQKEKDTFGENEVENRGETREEADKTNNLDAKMDETSPEEVVVKDADIQNNDLEIKNVEVAVSVNKSTDEAGGGIEVALNKAENLGASEETQEESDKTYNLVADKPTIEAGCTEVTPKEAENEEAKQVSGEVEQADHGADQERANGVTPPPSEEETKEKQEMQKNDDKYNFQVEGKAQHPIPSPVSC